jgi:cytoskeletal protein RodZ
MVSSPRSVDFGARLREARERRGLSLREIADATKIAARSLEALERNDIARLPGGIFSRAFVRAYAVHVGLDPEETISEFMATFPDVSVTQGHPRTRDQSILDELEEDSRKVQWPAVGWLALIGVLVAVLLTYALFTLYRGRTQQARPVSAATMSTQPNTEDVASLGPNENQGADRAVNGSLALTGHESSLGPWWSAKAAAARKLTSVSFPAVPSGKATASSR